MVEILWVSVRNLYKVAAETDQKPVPLAETKLRDRRKTDLNDKLELEELQQKRKSLPKKGDGGLRFPKPGGMVHQQKDTEQAYQVSPKEGNGGRRSPKPCELATNQQQVTSPTFQFNQSATTDDVATCVLTLAKTWQDSRLSWDPKYYDNVTTLNVRGNDIWTPTLTLKINADPVYKGLQKDVPVRVSSDGLVEWSVETLTTTVCDADPFFFPADTMECNICFSATTAIAQTIECQVERPAVDMGITTCNSYSTATPEGEWYRKDKIFAKDNSEACLAVHLSRIPLFHIATTVGPCIILVVLMNITFIMPLDRGDRIAFGVTILLSMVVSLVFVSDVLPVKGALPLFATLIILWMGLMGLFLFFTLAIIVIHDRQGSLSPRAKIIFLRYISKMLLLGDLTEEKRTGHGEACFPNKSDIEISNYAFQTDDMAAVAEGRRSTEQPSTPPTATGLKTTGSSGLPELISCVKEMTTVMKTEVGGLRKELGELTKAMKNEEEVSDYTLLAKYVKAGSSGEQEAAASHFSLSSSIPKNALFLSVLTLQPTFTVRKPTFPRVSRPAHTREIRRVLVASMDFRALRVRPRIFPYTPGFVLAVRVHGNLRPAHLACVGERLTIRACEHLRPFPNTRWTRINSLKTAGRSSAHIYYILSEPRDQRNLHNYEQPGRPHPVMIIKKGTAINKEFAPEYATKPAKPRYACWELAA
ncbi:hypothetical protein Bbelb_070340 [Branchiostoma belcheri]|nr:hypothetical protein Bbelb_070340 [Branchiostoma belcheri]